MLSISIEINEVHEVTHQIYSLCILIEFICQMGLADYHIVLLMLYAATERFWNGLVKYEHTSDKSEQDVSGEHDL